MHPAAHATPPAAIEPHAPAAASQADRNFFVFCAVVSVAALSFLTYILVLRDAGDAGPNLRFLPGVNAALNGLAASLLAAGWIAIRKKQQTTHKYLMVSAFAASTLFLVGYLTYHWAHGDTKFTGQGPIRAVYFAILITHILLSAAVVPMSLTAFYFAWRRAFARHRKVTRILAPIWLYVSITGVVIFLMLHGI